jgi:hypothetical protein
MNLCTGLKSKILKGAMPWRRRYVGNLLITWLLNRFYKVGVSDSQCGFRAFTRQALEKLKLEATGLEFATDMLIKARHAGLRIAKVPITYYPRAEGAPSKLKSFRDGWRHVEYILTYTPKHLYLYPGLALITLGIALMAIALINAQIGYSPGIHTSITGGMATIIGYNLLLLGAIADLTLARRLGLQPHPVTQRITKLKPMKAIVVGALIIFIGFTYLASIFFQWLEGGDRKIQIRGENAIARTIAALGIQIISSSFIFSQNNYRYDISNHC